MYDLLLIGSRIKIRRKELKNPHGLRRGDFFVVFGCRNVSEFDERFSLKSHTAGYII